MLTRRLSPLVLALVVGVPVIAAIPGGSLILAILGISFLIFVHEWGHFTACRLTGTRTETFSIGFGPRLFGWEKDREGRRRFTVGRRQLDPADHAMDFRVAAVPLGGYVKMAGEMPGERVGDGPPEPDEFPAKSAAARTFIICAGVIMNFITAVVFYFLTIQFQKSYTAPVVGEVQPGGAAWQAGIETGDRVREIDGVSTPTWIDVRMEIAFLSGDEPAPVVVERAGERRPPISVKPVYDEERGILQFGVSHALGLELGPEEARFEVGYDESVTVAGVPVRGGARALKVFQAALQNGVAPIVFERPSGERYVFELQGAADDEAPADSPGAKVGVMAAAAPVVKAVRGRAAGLLEAGDEMVAALAGSERLPVDSESDAAGLLFRSRLDALLVRREGSEVTVPVRLQSQAEVVAFWAEVALGAGSGNRVRPLAAGHTLFTGTALYRYPSSPAQTAGIPAGARILSVGREVTETWDEIAAAIRGTRAGEPLAMKIRTPEGTEKQVEVRPVDLEFVRSVPLTAVPYEERYAPANVLAAFGQGASRAWRETKNVFRTIGALFTGTISFDKNIAGPITLIDFSRKFAEDSWLRLIWFLAYVSVMLAVLNILPIPILDGGHLMFILIEKIKGAPLKDETIYRFQKIGFLLLLVLMFFAFKNDFTRIFS